MIFLGHFRMPCIPHICAAALNVQSAQAVVPVNRQTKQKQN